jgi:hypothetical protein
MSLLLKINELKKLWEDNKERYLKAERGSQGNEGFVTRFLNIAFELVENNDAKHKIGTFKNQLGTGQNNHTADFVLYPSENMVIPLEVEKLGKTQAGAKQLIDYQLDFDTKYGILTDGQTWRFFTSTTRYKEFDLEKDIFADISGFLTFWKEYINATTFYLNYFTGKSFDDLFEESIKPKVDENRERYFNITTKLVSEFKTKLIQKGFTPKEGLFENEDKKATEMAYSYLIQFILFKTLVDNNYFDLEYTNYIKNVLVSLQNKNHGNILKVIRHITDTVGNNIYKPFFKDQEDINKALSKLLFAMDNPELTEVSLFLDIIIYIDSFDFAGLGGDIFGYVYENYLKELYSDENKGQYFTDPKIAELMLEEMGWTVESLTLKLKNKQFDTLSLIDPACGSGTFLYSAVRTLIKACQKANLEAQKTIDLVVDNIVGFDVEEFPLYLAEMNILMRLLPIIYTEPKNPKAVEKRLKIFWSEDSLSEFLEIEHFNSQLARDKDSMPLFEVVPLPYHKFMRDEKELKTLKEDLLDTKRQKFDYVIANPPYIGYNECSKNKIKYFELIKKKEVKLNNVFGVNLHSTPYRHKKYSPKPNLYAFFLALNNTLLKQRGGKFCFIIPQTLLTAGDLDVMRYFISKNFQIKKLITFQNNLFINRGVKQTKQVATSSLIIVADKSLETTKTQILNYQKSEATVAETKTDLLARKNCKIKEILQSDLLAKYDNWNWIKHDQEDLDFYQKYLENSQSLEIYYNHEKAQKEFGDRFWFDGGANIDEKKLVSLEKKENIKFLDRKNNQTLAFKLQPKWLFYPKSENVNFPQGSQGKKVFDAKYKVLWRTKNLVNFQYSEEVFYLNGNQLLMINSNNKLEILYLFSLLNSNLNNKILNLVVKNEHEKDLLLAIKTIKDYIRIPVLNNSQKLEQKQELIKLAEQLLECEKVVLQDLVDFDSDRILPLKFTKWEIKGNNLILDTKFSFEILDKKDLIEETLTKEIGLSEFILNELQNLPILDKAKQDEIKVEMDGIVDGLYEIDKTTFR